MASVETALATAPMVATITVNSLADGAPSNNGQCTLREAILNANSNNQSGSTDCTAGTAGADVIVFNLGTGTPSIGLSSALPTITEPLTIKGNSGGATFVQLNGAGAGAGAHGLRISAGNSTIQRLVINRFNGNGILITGAGFNSIKGCLIGTNASGTAASANAVGVEIRGSSDNTIGGTAAGDRNVISANTGAGVLIAYDMPNTLAASANKVFGNYIGADFTGKVDLGNGGVGLEIAGGSNSIIGGVTAETRNVISGNDGGGVKISSTNATGNVLVGNLIGTDVGGIVPLGNVGTGVLIDGSPNNRIGGLGVPCPGNTTQTCSEGNTIKFNSQKGIVIRTTTAVNNSILGNSISNNTGFGIDLGDDGLNPLTVPGSPSSVSATAGNAQATVSFAPPTSNGGNTIIGYTATSSPGGITASAGSSPITVPGLTNGQAYTFTVTATNFVGTSAPSAASNPVTPQAPPFAPTDSSTVSESLAIPSNFGPNNFQNFPILTGVTVGTNSSAINGVLRSAASTTFRIEFFINTLCDPSDNGEGKTLIGSMNVTTSPLVLNDNTSGTANFSKALDYALPGGLYVTATATRLNAGTPVETSEFSACVAIPHQTSGCHVIPVPEVLSFSAAAASTTVEVNAGTLCVWSASSMADWITIGSGLPGIGSGAVVLNIAANTGAFRFGKVTIGGMEFTISQDAPCASTLVPTVISLPSQASTGTTTLFTGAACPWTATSMAPWVSVSTQTSGSGSTYIDFSVEANPGTTQRVGLVMVAGQSVILMQSAPCTATLTPTSKTFTAAGGSDSFSLAVGAACSWTAVASDPWITITSATSGSGNATISYTVAPHTGALRTGSISVAGQTFTIAQESPCNAMISQSSQSFMAAGGSGNFNVTIGAACQWQATTDSSWINITSGSGTGNGTVNFTVAANTGAQRSGQIAIAGLTFLVQQSSACPITLSPASQAFVTAGGTGSVSVTTGGSCQWMATVSVPWVSITSGGSGTGNGTINYSVTTNGTGGTRSGSITVGDKTFSISQEGNCSYTVSPTLQNFAASGGSNTVSVTANSSCAWMASSNDSWITITSSLQSPKDGREQKSSAVVRPSGKNSLAGTGNGTVAYTVAANTGPARTGTMFVAGTLVNITQASGCPINITPANLPAGQLGTNYNQMLSQSGGTGAITWTISNGSLPAGIMLGSGSGVLSGIPTVQGMFSITVRATDANGCFGEMMYMLQINCQSLSITPTSLTPVTVGAPYNQQLTLNGGSGSINWAITTGSLPFGVSLDPSSGLLAGTINAGGTFNFTVRATINSTGCFAERSYSLTVNCQSVTVNPTTINPGNIGTPYSQQFTQTGGSGTITWSLSSGTLPNNLTLSGGGLLSGTPTASGNFPITVRATDGNGCFGERSYTLAIGVCATITVNPTTLPSGLINTNYNQTLTASGGAPGYTFSVSGTLPNGITLSSGGVLSGSPTVVGTYNFDVTATDQGGCTGSRSYSLVICSVITVNPTTLPSGIVGQNYSQSLSAVGGGSPHNFSFSGTLPNGLSLDNAGLLSGIPTQTGTFTFTVTATDTSACTGSRSYTVVITGAGLMFYPLPSPIRLLDTRPGESGCDTPGAPIPGNTSRLQTAAGRTCSGITIPASAKALTGNVTTVQSGGGFLTLYPSDAPTRPLVANSNYLPDQVLNNVFTVGLGAGDGAFKIYVTSNTHVVVDVTGYYAPPGAGGLYFHPLPNPIRLLETRAGESGCDTPGVPITGGVARLQQGRVFCGGTTIPSNAAALVGNATTVSPNGAGFLTFYPGDVLSQPFTATSNYEAAQTMNGPFTVGLASNGTFRIYSSATTHLVVDVLGYYSTDPVDLNGPGLFFNPLPRPVRLLETRSGEAGCYAPGAPLAAGSTRIQQARGVCDSMTIAANAQAIVGNATVVSPSAAGYLTFWPSNAVTQPLVATSNYLTGDIFNRHFTVGLGADGAFKIFTLSTTHLVIDVSGYFAP